MQFSTALVALVAALPAFAAPVPPRGPHGHPHPHHHHEERSLEERAPEPKGHGFAKAAGHFAGHAASSYMNQKRDGHRAHGGHGQGHHPHGSHHQQQVSERDLEERSPEPKGHGFAKAAGHFAKHAAAAYNEKRDGHRAHGGHGQGHHPHGSHHQQQVSERDLEERSPKGHGFAKAAGRFAGHAASSYMNQKRDGHRAHGGHGQGHHPHGGHHQQQVSERDFDDFEELEARDLEERSPEPKGHGFAKAAGHFAKHAAAAYNEKRDGHRAHGGHGQGHHPHGSHHQQQVSERDFDDFEELEARDLEERSPEPKGHGFAKAAGHFAKHAAAAYNEKRDGHRAHGGHGQGHHPHGGHHQQQVSERDFDDFEELEARDLVEEIEARSFDEPVDIDLMIRELGSADEDALYF